MRQKCSEAPSDQPRISPRPRTLIRSYNEHLGGDLHCGDLDVSSWNPVSELTALKPVIGISSSATHHDDPIIAGSSEKPRIRDEDLRFQCLRLLQSVIAYASAVNYR